MPCHQPVPPTPRQLADLADRAFFETLTFPRGAPVLVTVLPSGRSLLIERRDGLYFSLVGGCSGDAEVSFPKLKKRLIRSVTPLSREEIWER
jgi:hypothetical protein